MTDFPAVLQASLATRYDVQREVGRGGAATVYLARDLMADRDVAIKVLRPELVASLSAERFLREIRLAGRLRHPNILPIEDAGEEDGFLYAVLPFVHGNTLRHRMERERQFPVDEAVRIASQIADALSFAHQHGVIHRDIKPENVLLSDVGALVADFGIARAIDDSNAERLTEAGSALGTPAYMSPEQAAGDRDVDARSDVYSLGCVLYELLTGEPPFTGRTAQSIIVRHFRETPLPIRALRATAPEAIEHAVTMALAKAPVDRHASARAFLVALSEASVPATSRDSAVPTRAVSARPNRGALVSKMCNRWQHVNEFDAFLRSNYRERPREPQVFVVPGQDGEGHESLLERLVATSIAHLASDIGGGDRGTVAHKRVAWPESDDDALRARDLVISLFRECDPAYMGVDSSADALAGLASLAHLPVVVFQHDVRANRWDAAATELLDWYVGTFWTSLRVAPAVPQFLVFINVMKPARQSVSWASRFLARGRERDLEDALRRLATSNERRCPTMVFRELASVTADDVKDWFSKHGIGATELERRDLAAQLFSGTATKSMIEVESALRRIHQSYVITL